VRLRILSRASDLARLQAMLVGRAIEASHSGITVEYITRIAAGDRDTTTPLASLPTKGAFTADLSDELTSGRADLVVHSWKDLPLDERPDTIIAATLERADPRDLLLVRRDVVSAERPALRVLSSSPRRGWLLEPLLPALLPWSIETVEFLPVRGNIATRLTRLLEGRGDALVVAKAAIDRLLTFGQPFEEAATVIRHALDQCRWMVLPSREVPGAPAQGALAVEIAATNDALRDRLRAISHEPTWRAVRREREVLAEYGGGCHEALGATVLPRDYGDVTSVRAKTSRGDRADTWSLACPSAPQPRAEAGGIWPRRDERGQANRRLLDVAQPADDRGFWVARAEALPISWAVPLDRIVWAAGDRTWRRLAERGVWVHGSAEGLGDTELPGIDALAGRRVGWYRLTHTGMPAVPGMNDAQVLATYEVDEPLPDDLAARTNFFWTSGTSLARALDQWPEIRNRWHASGPGRTWHVLRGLVPPDRARVALDYETWIKEVVE
jgi:hydroxymethylbilane synthase